MHEVAHRDGLWGEIVGWGANGVDRCTTDLRLQAGRWDIDWSRVVGVVPANPPGHQPPLGPRPNRSSLFGFWLAGRY